MPRACAALSATHTVQAGQVTNDYADVSAEPGNLGIAGGRGAGGRWRALPGAGGLGLLTPLLAPPARHAAPRFARHGNLINSPAECDSSDSVAARPEHSSSIPSLFSSTTFQYVTPTSHLKSNKQNIIFLEVDWTTPTTVCWVSVVVEGGVVELRVEVSALPVESYPLGTARWVGSFAL